MSTLWTLAITLTGCGGTNLGQQNSTATVLAPYVEHFYARAAHYGHTDLPKISVVFEEGYVATERIASCYEDRGIIGVDPVQWETLEEAQKLALLMHELGHCALGQTEHRTDYIDLEGPGGYDITTPKSLMNEFLIPGFSYETWPDYYEEELFHFGQ